MPKSVKDTSKRSKIRSYTNDSVVHENYVLLFGYRPSLQVERNTKLVSEVIHTLYNKYDREDLNVDVLPALKQIADKNTQFELITSVTA